MRILLTLLLLFFATISFGQTAAEYFKAATSFAEKGQQQNALLQINKALKTDSLNLDYLAKKGEILQSLKMYKQANEVYGTAISAEPKNTYFYNQRGLLMNSNQQFAAAINDFTTAIQYAYADSIKNMLLVNRAAAEINSRKFDAAYKDLLVVYDKDSSNIAMLNNLAAVSDEVGKGNETLRYLLRIIALKPDFYAAYGNIGFKYQEMGDYKKAIEYYNKVLQFKPNDPLGFSNRSYNRLKLNDVKGAYEDIERSLKLYPTNSYAYRVRALIYIQDNKIPLACADLKKAVELGFTPMYGDEVIKLQAKYCGK